MDIIRRASGPHLKVLRQIYSYAAAQKAGLYLVGGYMRDIYLGRQKQDPDIDMCIARGAIPFGRGLARRLKCGYVVLDEAHGCCRLVLQTSGPVYTIDISDFRAPTLAEDLALRDFSVNSVCLALADLIEDPCPAGCVIDPCGGRLDIKKKRLRIMYKRAFVDDPLRIVRAFSLAAIYGFTIESACLSAAGRTRRRLTKVSPERIRDEMFKVLESGAGVGFLRSLDAHGILELVFPEIRALKRVLSAGRTRVEIWRHTLGTVEALERLCRRLMHNADIAGYLQARLAGSRSAYALLTLAALLHDAGKPRTFKYDNGRVSFYGHERVGSRMAADIARRLRLSNDEQRWLSRITFLHLRPGYLASMPAVTARAVYRFFRDTGREAPAVLLLALADERATAGYDVVDKIRPRYERLMFRLIRIYFERHREAPRKRLVTGHDIMRLGQMPPSEAVGAILRELEETLAVNSITTRKEALAYAGLLIKKTRMKSGRRAVH